MRDVPSPAMRHGLHGIAGHADGVRAVAGHPGGDGVQPLVVLVCFAICWQPLLKLRNSLRTGSISIQKP